MKYLWVIMIMMLMVMDCMKQDVKESLSEIRVRYTSEILLYNTHIEKRLAATEHEQIQFMLNPAYAVCILQHLVMQKRSFTYTQDHRVTIYVRGSDTYSMACHNAVHMFFGIKDVDRFLNQYFICFPYE